MPKVLSIISHSESETVALGRKMADMLPDGNVVVLSGELGSGKTVFVRGLADGMGAGVQNVHSPTFTIVHEYHGKRNLYHLDLYRLSDRSELYEIGWDDYLQREGLVVVEWGEKVEQSLPDRYFRIDFKMINENEREINVSLVEQ